VPADAHVVVRGDCLWDLAEARLRASGAEATPAAVASAVQAWWSVNADVIGSDPDLIHPGQVLRAPDRP
jgi:nucleoid-associated protein YgaU